MQKERGLTSLEVKTKLKEYGKNQIKKTKKSNPVKIFISQFTSSIILMLIFAALLSFFVNFLKHQNYFDSILIIIIVLFAGIAGFIQNYKAEKAVEALQNMATPKAKVIREGKEQIINSTEIVPGDIIVIEGGDLIPADAVLINGRVEVDESILTGESKNVNKKPKNKIFSGCGVYAGKSMAKVFATGMNTEIGKIANKMQEIKENTTPFQNHMKKFTKKIVIFTILIIILTFLVGFRKFGVLEAGLIAVSLAVAAIPEDLPAVVTVALSLGARKMAKRNALVRKLSIVESIGSTDIICTDKTGTITKGKMEVKDFWMLKKNNHSKDLALKCCYYCNDAKRILKDNEEKWIGDETDIALKQYSSKFIKEHGERIEEIPFTSEKKMMTVIQKLDKKLIFSKGAPEIILEKSDRYLINDQITPLNEKLRKKILNKNKELASKGYRVLALAYKDYEKPIESGLIFLSLIILSDPVRPEVTKALKDCYSAGIRTIMITGDNPLTAQSIAKEVGIKTKGVLTGKELDNMSDDDLRYNLRKGINVFARTNPFHKLKILETLQKDGHIVAMTGDGVNDSLALKKADVGIAMGIKGTEVAREASDIILLDDNFSSIRNAIQEGRRIFDNIRKFVDYLFTCNVAEVVVVLLATIFLPFISLFPIQILWINLVTDGLPALALSVDRARPNIMKRKPRKKNEGIINKKLGILIGSIGIKKSLIIIASFLIVLKTLNLGINHARTVLFTGFIMYEFVRIGVIRYNEKLPSLKDWFTNKILIYSLLISITLQIVIIYTPLSKYFKVVPLGIKSWTVLIIGTILGFVLGVLIAKIADKLTKEDY